MIYQIYVSDIPEEQVGLKKITITPQNSNVNMEFYRGKGNLFYYSAYLSTSTGPHTFARTRRKLISSSVAKRA